MKGREVVKFLFGSCDIHLMIHGRNDGGEIEAFLAWYLKKIANETLPDSLRAKP
jgi:hypothetical protein